MDAPDCDAEIEKDGLLEVFREWWRGVSDFWNEMECEALYRIAINELNLDLGTVTALTRTGVISVGDCIDLLLRFDAGHVSHIFGYGQAEHENLVAQLKSKGFWIYLRRSRNRSYIWTDALYATKDCL